MVGVFIRNRPEDRAELICFYFGSLLLNAPVILFIGYVLGISLLDSGSWLMARRLCGFGALSFVSSFVSLFRACYLSHVVCLVAAAIVFMWGGCSYFAFFYFILYTRFRFPGLRLGMLSASALFSTRFFDYLGKYGYK